MKQLIEKQNSEDITRIAIVTVLIALNFYIIQYFEDKKLDIASFESVLKIYSKVFIGLTLLIFLLFIITLGISKSYNLRYNKKIHQYFYDIGIGLSLMIFILTGIILIGLKLCSYINNKYFLYFIFLIMAIIGIKISSNLFSDYSNKLAERMKSIFKK